MRWDAGFGEEDGGHYGGWEVEEGGGEWAVKVGYQREMRWMGMRLCHSYYSRRD